LVRPNSPALVLIAQPFIPELFPGLAVNPVWRPPDDLRANDTVLVINISITRRVPLNPFSSNSVAEKRAAEEIDVRGKAVSLWRASASENPFAAAFPSISIQGTLIF